MLTIITQRSSFQFISNNNKGSHVSCTESRERQREEEGEEGGERRGAGAWTELKWPSSRCLVTAFIDGEFLYAEVNALCTSAERKKYKHACRRLLRLFFCQRIIYFLLQCDEKQ